MIIDCNTSSLKSTDNWAFFVLKAFCAFGVVLLHARPIWMENVLLHPFMRAAVPCFLMISGYYLVDGELISAQKVKRQIKKVLGFIVLYNSIFFLWRIFLHAVDNTALISPEVLTIRYWLRWVFIGDNICYPYWYLTAYLFALLIILFVGDRQIVLYYIAPVLCLLAVLLNRYSFLLTTWELDLAWSRNAMLCGLPGIVIGAFIRKQEGLFISLPPLIVSLVFCAVCFFAYCEYFVLNYFNIGSQGGGDYYIFTFPLAFALVILSMWLDSRRQQMSYDKRSNHLLGALALLGKNHSSNVYLFHVWILSFIGFLGRFFHVPLFFETAEVVYFFTVLFSSVVNYRRRFGK